MFIRVHTLSSGTLRLSTDRIVWVRREKDLIRVSLDTGQSWLLIDDDLDPYLKAALGEQ